ncbi:MAG: DUF885 domain-containing protein [Lachnospiraceae bacterium]|nr:DUF885 domain-containing protein [Lachnospiraceae bacterium]
MSTSYKDTSKKKIFTPKRIVILIVFLAGVSILIAWAIIRFNPSIYRSLFLASSKDTPESLDPDKADTTPVSYSDTDNSDFNDYTNKLLNLLVTSDTNTYNSSMEHPERYGVEQGKYSLNPNNQADTNAAYLTSFTDLKKRLATFDYSSLSFKQQKAYDEIRLCLDSYITKFTYPDLSEHKYSGSLSSQPNGKEYYEQLLENSIGAGKTVDEYYKMNNAYLEQFFKGLDSTSSGDQKKYKSYSTDGDPNEILNKLKEMSKEHFPAVQDAQYTIEYSEDEGKYFVDAARYIIPPLDDINKSKIILNKNAVNYSRDLFTILAHEGYPGHMYQVSYLSDKINKGEEDPVRYFTMNNGYTEGFASYAEYLSYSYNDSVESGVSDVAKYYNFGYNAIYAKIDIEANYYGKSIDELRSFLSGYGIRDSKVQDDLYNDVTTNPGSRVIYAVGLEEVFEMQRKAKDIAGDNYSDDKFNRLITELGPMGFKDIEKRLYMINNF